MGELNSSQLNKDQRKAVSCLEGAELILAGAGSGKTKVLISKVLRLIEKGVDPSSIVMITFTNKAAKEMKRRIGRPKLGFIGTFHAFCARVLRISGKEIGLANNFVIYDQKDQFSVIKKILKKIGHQKDRPSSVLRLISKAKNNLVLPEKNSFAGEIYYRYQNELKRNKALDFDDLIVKTVMLLQKSARTLSYYQRKYRYFLVDEFQDTNYAQYCLIKLFAWQEKNLTIVGDFSQSIYSWRGADLKNLQRFKKDFPSGKIFHLEVNYRSTQSILNFAFQIISQNHRHPILKLRTNNQVGDQVEFFEAINGADEAYYVLDKIISSGKKYRDYAVLYRTNAQSRIIEEAFLNQGIPYILMGGVRFYERKEIKDILSYLRLVLNPYEVISLERVVKIGKRRYSKFQELLKEKSKNFNTLPTRQIIRKILVKTNYLNLYDPSIEEDSFRLDNIKELESVATSYPVLSDFLEKITLVESEYSLAEKKSSANQGVKLMTLHQAKGLEFPYVFIVGLEEGILPHSRSLDDDRSLEEERRLFYVGITRAKKKLYITSAKRRTLFGKRRWTVKSRFIDDQKKTNYFF